MRQLKKVISSNTVMLIFCFFVLIILLLIVLAGCSSNEISENEQEKVHLENISMEDYSSEIESWGNDTVVIGSVNHGIRREEIEELVMNDYITYDGGEIKIPYKVSASGKATNIGFLLFVDGKPQAYCTSEFEEYEYCHVLQLEENLEIKFDFCFMPSVGKEGETLELTILSVYYPDFIPDMEQTSSYGMYHQTLEVTCKIKMGADSFSDTTKMITDNIVNNVDVEEMEITQDYLSGPITLQYGMQEITQESLDNNIFNVVLLGGQYYTDNYLLSSNSLAITFEMCGKDETEYYVTPFINHIPISDTQLVTVRKGKISFITYSIDTTMLENFQTFYIIAFPVNNDDFMQIKTPSILLYKEERCQ